MKIIAVIDGQGGGIGRALCERLCPALEGKARVVALGTNAFATSVMLKAGAHAGATGDNAIIYNASRADLIAGPLGILPPNALMGELSEAVASAIGKSDAMKVLVPIPRCGVRVAGADSLTLAEAIEQAADIVIQALSDAL